MSTPNVTPDRNGRPLRGRAYDCDHVADRIVACAKCGCWLDEPQADGGWIACETRMPELGAAVWCYWPDPRRDYKVADDMQGCAVRGTMMPGLASGDMTLTDYWHAQHDKYDTRFAPTHWRPLPPPPTQKGDGA